VARDTDTILATSHLSSEDYSSSTSESVLFASNSTCILNPEGETGPYWVKGEHIRSNLTDGEPGVPVILDGQFVDVETCEPIVGLYWDIWNCNSTGVYSGLVATGNGNTADASNLNATFLRGVQKSDDDGVVQFITVFPGHYSGRTTHIHMVAHINATVLPNNTLTGGTVGHVGQIFWDQDLIDAVEATYPYNTNTVAITQNADDRVFATETATTSDPVIEDVMLGDDLSDGLFGKSRILRSVLPLVQMFGEWGFQLLRFPSKIHQNYTNSESSAGWVTIAVNVSATYDPNYSYVYTASGGAASSGGTTTVDGGSGTGTMGGGNSTGNGTMPSGSAPSGAMPSQS